MTPNRTPKISRGNNGEFVFGRSRGVAIEDYARYFSNHGAFDAVQLEPGPACCDLDWLCAAGIAVCRQRTIRRLHCRCELREGWVSLGFVSGKGGRLVPNGRLRFAEIGRSFEWFPRSGETVVLAMFEPGALRRLAGGDERLGGLLEKLADGSHFIPGGDLLGAAEGLHSEIQTLLDGAKVGKLPCGAGLPGESLPRGFLTLLAGSKEPPKRAPRGRFLIGCALAASEGLQEPFRVSNLCRALGMSSSGLCNAFAKTTGVRTHGYFLRRRLTHVRKVLAGAAVGKDSVRQIALDSGLTELGRFAVRYRAFFGEKPSQTLKRPQRKVEPLPG